MTTIDAVYHNGTFQLLGRIDLPENSHVRLQVEPVEMRPEEQAEATDAVYEMMSHRFRSARGDLSERHNEHQP